jgi:hypothetical protein
MRPTSTGEVPHILAMMFLRLAQLSNLEFWMGSRKFSRSLGWSRDNSDDYD